MTIEQTWNNGGYLSGLKGVTIPNNTPSFNEDPSKGTPLLIRKCDSGR